MAVGHMQVGIVKKWSMGQHTFRHVVDDGHHHAALVVDVCACKQQCHDSHAVHMVGNALRARNATANPTSALVDLVIGTSSNRRSSLEAHQVTP